MLIQLISSLRLGANKESAIVLGIKNYSIFSDLNKKYRFFKNIYALEHPRCIMQYRRRRLQEYLKKPHTSFPANPFLANALYLADYAQRAGSGTIEMIKQCKAQGAPDPEFVLIRNVEFRTILPRDVFTEDVLSKIGLNERQLKAVKYVKEKGQISNQIYQEINNTTKRTASRDLTVLVSSSVFKKTGVTGKGTLYTLGGHKGDTGKSISIL